MQRPKAIWSRFEAHLWLALPVIAAAALWPFVADGLPRSFDGGLHLLRLSLLDFHLQRGDAFPRWVPEALLGYGYPLFNFYAPLAYYLAESFHLLGLSFYHAFVAALAAFLLAAGLGMFLLARDIFGRARPWPALLAAAAYMVGPYLLTNVYIRGAIAEAGAQALLPFVLWSFRRLLRSGRPARYLPAAALSLAGLALMHTISLLFLPPLLLGFIAVHWWQGGRSRPDLGWTIAALALAAGMSAFFWLPLAGERSQLAGTAYEIARTVWLPGSVWRWDNFLDAGLTFAHSFDRPVRLGLAQVLLAAAGFLLARRRDAEWLFFLAVSLIAGLLMTAWALPLWLSNDFLVAAQFAWRLLSVLSLPLALFTGGIVAALRPGWRQAAVTTALLALVLFVHAPRLGWMDFFAPAGTGDLGPAVAAQLELDKGAIEGGQFNSSVQEFRPRWADETLLLAPASVSPLPEPDLALLRGNAYDLELSYAADQPASLRFNNFYFPGWQVRLDRHTDLAPYPSTNLGLLTVDLPAGSHELALSWQGTGLQRWAGWISLLALAALAGLLGLRGEPRWLAALPLALLILGLVASRQTRDLSEVAAPENAVEAGGVRLLGYRLEQDGPGHLYVYPYWLVTERPTNPLFARWEIRDQAGAVQAQVVTRPYFNTIDARNWPAGTIVDDAYRLPLPPGLPAGRYEVAVRLAAEDRPDQPAAAIGPFELARTVPPQESPQQPLDVVFDGVARLDGFELAVQRQPIDGTAGRPRAAQAGDRIDYTLFWRAGDFIGENYHGFVHLVAADGRPLAQEDHLPGPLFRPPALWDAYYRQADVYRLKLPDDAPAGVYWPIAGLYRFETLERLAAADGDGQALADVRLPPLKVLRSQTPAPQHKTAARFDDLADLLGYDLQAPAGGIRAGQAFTLTLYLRGLGTTSSDLVRFVHLYDPAAGMAAQQDSRPQDGANPTWSWLPGEIIVDTVVLRVADAAAPGNYGLAVGLYDPASGARLPVYGPGGERLPDDQASLAGITVQDGGW